MLLELLMMKETGSKAAKLDKPRERRNVDGASAS